MPPAPPALDERRLRQLLDVSVRLNAAESPAALLQHIIETAADVLACDAASLLLYDRVEDRLRFVAATGSSREALARIPVPLHGSIAGTIFREERAVFVDNAEDDARHFKAVGEKVAFTTRTLLGVPMRAAGRTVGVLEALNKRGGAFDEADREALAILADHAAVALNNLELRTSLRAAYAEVARTDELKSRFLALTSHELRTPLAAVRGYADALRAEAAPDTLVAEFAGAVASSSERMQTVLDAMGEVTALRAGAAALACAPVAVQDVARDAFARVRAEAQAAGLRLHLALDPEPAWLRADGAKLGTALRNVLQNAVRFTPPGGRLTLRAGRNLGGGGALVEVADTGAGLAPEHLTAVFDEFFQVGEMDTRTHEGLGLGLAVARAIVEAHGGRIRASSPGLRRGSTFTLVLPLAEPPPARPGQPLRAR